jgi:hypothetical protein
MDNNTVPNTGKSFEDDNTIPRMFEVVECTLVATPGKFIEGQDYFELYASPTGANVTYRVDALGNKSFLFHRTPNDEGDTESLNLYVEDTAGGVNIDMQRARNSLPVINLSFTEEQIELLAGRYNHAYFLFLCRDRDNDDIQYLVYLETFIKFDEGKPILDEEGNYTYDKRLLIEEIINPQSGKLTLSNPLGHSNVIVMKDPNGKNVYLDLTKSFSDQYPVEKITQIDTYSN